MTDFRELFRINEIEQLDDGHIRMLEFYDQLSNALLHLSAEYENANCHLQLGGEQIFFLGDGLEEALQAHLFDLTPASEDEDDDPHPAPQIRNPST